MTVIIYGSTTGNTEEVARKIAEEMGDARLVNAADAAPDDLSSADRIILGTSTWGVGDLQDDWEGKMGLFDGLDLSGKKAAVFGLGDQEGYPDSFVDGMGILAGKLSETGAELVGTWPVEGYEFDESGAVTNGQFVGLALDEDNQSDLTDQRIRDWIGTL